MYGDISSRCLSPCEVTCTQPWSYSNSLGPCVASCGDSRAVVFAPPVVLTFPGPIISSCPQESIVGTSFPETYVPMIPYSSGNSSGMGGSFGSGGMSGMGGSFGSGGMSGMRGSYGSGYGGSSGTGGCYSKWSYRSSRGSRRGSCSSL